MISSPSPASPVAAVVPAPTADFNPVAALSQKFTPRQEALYSEVLRDILREKQHDIVLYDGVCLVCDATVNFVSDRDPQGRLHFAPLQSDFGAYCLQVHRVPPMDSMILIEGGPSVPPTPGYAPWFCRSTGILRIAARLHPRWLFAFLWILLLIPEVIRDAGYKVFAALRYRVFGKVSSSSSSSSGSNCRLVTKATRGRFVEYQVKDLEKAWRKKEKETEQQEGGKSCSTPAAASPPPLSSLKITAQESRDIRARTDAEMELRHGHAHSPGHRMGEVTTTEAEAHGVGAESEPAHQHEASAEQSEGAAADGIQRRKQQKATQ